MAYKILFFISSGLLIITVFIIFKLRRNLKIIRIPRLKKPDKIIIGDYLGHVYGIVGIIALGITAYGVYSSYNLEDSETTSIVKALIISLLIVIVSYVAASAYFVNKTHKWKQCVSEKKLLDIKLDNLDIVTKYQSELFHSITHYQRNIINRLFNFIQNQDNYNEEDIENLKSRVHDFMVVLTSNLQSYFSFITQDNCSVTIKKVSDDKNYVETFFRDPVNLKKRRKSDEEYKENGGRYKIEDNTAFKIISDPKFKNIFFYDNNLKELWDKDLYENSNSNWEKHYNATIVVPISMVLKKESRDIVGFLTVDNRVGRLANDTYVEFLFGIADLIYNLFLYYTDFINFVESKKTEQ